MTIKLPPEIDKRLHDEASRQGMKVDDYAATLIERGLTATKPNQATLDLLAKREREEATDDPEEIARRQKEGEEFMQSLARSRVEMEGPNARKLWP